MYLVRQQDTFLALIFQLLIHIKDFEILDPFLINDMERNSFTIIYIPCTNDQTTPKKTDLAIYHREWRVDMSGSGAWQLAKQVCK